VATNNDDTSIAPGYTSLGGRHYCPVVLPYFAFAEGPTALDRLRRRIYSLQLQRHPRRRRRTSKYFVLWPFSAMATAWRASRVWGPAAQGLGAPSPWRQATRIWWLAVRHNLTFNVYYGFRLWRDDAVLRGVRFLEDHEWIWICDEILAGQDRMSIDDKVRFADFCRRHGLPTIPPLVSISGDGQVHWPGAERRLPPCDLFVKNRALWSGIGASVWTWDAGRERYCCGDLCLDQEGLLAHLCEQLESGGENAPDSGQGSRNGFIVQARVRNHPSIADMSPHAVSTLRCYTGRCGDEPAVVYRSHWRLPRRGMITDHASRGGMSVAVADDGSLLRPRSRLLTRVSDDHPDFQVRITDRRLPDYQVMLSLCRRAHDASGINGILAWDVALLDSGPVLVEGGTSGSIEALQIAHDLALGDAEIVDEAMKMLDAVSGTVSRTTR